MRTTTSIVLADDHAVFREGTRRLLAEEPDLKVVGEAANGEEAVAAVRSLKPDIVLMDVVMPGLNGVEATREIKRSQPGTAVLILTAYDDDRYVLGLLEAGAAGYLLKSAHSNELIQAIRAIAAGEAVLDPGVIAKLLSRATRKAAAPSEHSGEHPTEREMDVLRLAGKGLANKEIAAELVLSVPTVKAHLVNIFNKMAVGSRTEAVLQAVRRGWIHMEDVTPPGVLPADEDVLPEPGSEVWSPLGGHAAPGHSDGHDDAARAAPRGPNGRRG
ncbi:MAG: response regulator transcription factor [Chloroflexi bacterium]|nr:response regulator transcription factor [Chloroflexota bacterium]